MAAYSSSHYSAFLFIVVLILLPLPSSASGGFSVELIHRDSIQSPLYDPNSTPVSRLHDSVIRSRARARYFSYLSDKDIGIDSDIIPISAEYLMVLYIGTPPLKTIAIADTGSDLVWFQCKPCNDCYLQNPPLFDSSNSSTYKSVSCKTDSCSALPVNSCDYGNKCKYRYSYGDSSYVIGDLARETLSFDSANGSGCVPVPDILFGCTHRSNGTFNSAGAGLVGLGGGQLSLINQLGDAIDNKFSYCLPSPNNNVPTTGRLNFGSKSIVSGPAAVSTPISRDASIDTFFFLNLEHISVGGTNTMNAYVAIAMEPAAATEVGNIIIDSGTTMTMINEESLQSLEAGLLELVKLPSVSDPQGLFNLCFDLSGHENGEAGLVPDIIFHFSGDAEVVLKPINAFVKTDEATLCLAIISDGGSVSIFGNLAQQNYNIEYDLGAMMLTFAPADCSKL